MDNPHACLQCNRYLHRIRELEALVRMAWEATLDFRTTYNGRPSNFREAEIETGKSLCDCNDALEEFLYPESQSDAGTSGEVGK
jgi:hypothetical protein